MSAPETIYVPRSTAVARTERMHTDDIPYHREKTCSWKWSGPSDQVYLTACGERMGWEFHYCPYCGGRVEIADDDAGVVNA